MPMKYFTQMSSPSEQTLDLIKKIARTYRAIKLSDGSCVPLCVN